MQTTSRRNALAHTSRHLMSQGPGAKAKPSGERRAEACGARALERRRSNARGARAGALRRSGPERLPQAPAEAALERGGPNGAATAGA